MMSATTSKKNVFVEAIGRALGEGGDIDDVEFVVRHGYIIFVEPVSLRVPISPEVAGQIAGALGLDVGDVFEVRVKVGVWSHVSMVSVDLFMQEAFLDLPWDEWLELRQNDD
jgi:hypothetical protein